MAGIVFGLAHLTKHILLFCGIDDRIQCSYLNKTTNLAYRKIIPNISDVTTLFGKSIEMWHGTTKLTISPINIIDKSYLLDTYWLYDNDGYMGSIGTNHFSI